VTESKPFGFDAAAIASGRSNADLAHHRPSSAVHHFINLFIASLIWFFFLGFTA